VAYEVCWTFGESLIRSWWATLPSTVPHQPDSVHIWRWGGEFSKARNHFMNCVFVANIKSPIVFFVQRTLGNLYTWPSFPPGLAQSFALIEFHVQATLKSESLRVQVPWNFNFALMINKLANEISLVMAFHILYDFLVHRFYKSSHKVNKNISWVRFKFIMMCKNYQMTKCTCCHQACQCCGNGLLPRKGKCGKIMSAFGICTI
jgi:hypothetical protein